MLALAAVGHTPVDELDLTTSGLYSGAGGVKNRSHDEFVEATRLVPGGGGRSIRRPRSSEDGEDLREPDVGRAR